MTNHEKRKKIIPWIDPAERVTVHFLDVKDLVAEVRQHVSIPLSQTEVSEDLGHYTRDPERPLKRHRLMLVVNETRPAIIY
jgi:hypothetical protein